MNILSTIICVFILLFAFTQRYFGRRAYYNRNAKTVKQYRAVNIITALILFVLGGLAIATAFGSCSEEENTPARHNTDAPLGVASTLRRVKSKAPALQRRDGARPVSTGRIVLFEFI
jgi:ABC-type Fe3+ transport system permease subunit